MAVARWIVALLHGALIGIGIAVVLWLLWSPCDAKAFLFDFPVHAFMGSPPPLSEAPWLGECAEQTTPLKTWLFLWGPICLTICVAGATASRRANVRFAGAIGGAAAGAVPMLFALATELSYTPLISAAGLNAIGLSLGLVIISGGLGLAGAWIYQRHA